MSQYKFTVTLLLSVFVWHATERFCASVKATLWEHYFKLTTKLDSLSYYLLSDIICCTFILFYIWQESNLLKLICKFYHQSTEIKLFLFLCQSLICWILKLPAYVSLEKYFCFRIFYNKVYEQSLLQKL